MKILAHVHGYPGPGGHNAGAERSIQAIMEWLAHRGHECHVITPGRSPEGVWRGVTVEHLIYPSTAKSYYKRADIIITHLDLTKNVVRLAKAQNKPVVHLIHNHKQTRFHRLVPDPMTLCVFNSQWTFDESRWEGKKLIMHPPFNFYDVMTRAGDKITLVNLMADKGGELFLRLAEALPDHPFLGVKGSYGEQILPENPLPNLQIMDNTHEMTNVFSQTKLLLMPSSYESFGRVGIEAMACGIPVIAHPTPGLKEALGWAGIWADRLDTMEWILKIRGLMQNEREWYPASRAAKRWAFSRFANDEGLKQLEKAMEDLCRIPASTS